MIKVIDTSQDRTWKAKDLNEGDVVQGKCGTHYGLFLREFEAVVFLNDPQHNWTFDPLAAVDTGPTLTGRLVDITITVES